MEIPTLGRPGSIISIFIPGIFVLLNTCFGLYVLISYTSLPILENLSQINEQTPITAIINSSFIVSLFFVCFGYLIGVVLRLIRCSLADRISGIYWTVRFKLNKIRKKTIRYLTIARHKKKKKTTNFGKLINNHEKFPYLEYIIRKYEKQNELFSFYNYFKVIQDQILQGDKRDKRSLFNSLKMIILYINKDLAIECFAAEALNRYIASILYGILFSIGFLLLITLIVYFQPETPKPEGILYVLLMVIMLYLIPFFIIIKNYRSSRIREVEIVFSALLAIKEDPKFPKEFKEKKSLILSYIH